MMLSCPRLVPLLDAVRQAGLEASVFHFPDAYGMREQGREPWSRYIDHLVEEINRVAGLVKNTHLPILFEALEIFRGL